MVLPMDPIWLSTPHGEHRGVHASRFLDRLLGIRRIGDAELVVIPGSSVHGMGLDTPLSVAGVSADGEITRIATLRPWRILLFPGAIGVIESQPGSVPLRPGDRIVVRPREM
jgi:hypothetical protein